MAVILINRVYLCDVIGICVYLVLSNPSVLLDINFMFCSFIVATFIYVNVQIILLVYYCKKVSLI